MVNWPDTDQVSRCTDALQQSSEVNRSMNWLALDIGGANIKIADGLGYAATIPFALWKSPGELSNVLETILAVAPTGEHLAVTMTGELADCFASKTEGVQHIVRHTLVAAGDRSVRFYLHDRTLAPAESVLAQPLLAAASNWLALARFAGRYCEHSSAVLIDIGSTTSDIVPILDGVPRPMGHSDTQRLLHGELVYTGVMRSPVCAIVGSFPYRNQFCPVSQELFATSRDIYLLLQELPEDPNCTNTADSRPATRVHARQRMARMICAEPNEFSSDDALLAAQFVARFQLARIAVALGRVLGRMKRPVEKIIYSGAGEFLGRQLVERLRLQQVPAVSMSHELGSEVSQCAPAHALAVLAREDYP